MSVGVRPRHFDGRCLGHAAGTRHYYQGCLRCVGCCCGFLAGIYYRLARSHPPAEVKAADVVGKLADLPGHVLETTALAHFGGVGETCTPITGAGVQHRHCSCRLLTLLDPHAGSAREYGRRGGVSVRRVGSLFFDFGGGYLDLEMVDVVWD